MYSAAAFSRGYRPDAHQLLRFPYPSSVMLAGQRIDRPAGIAIGAAGEINGVCPTLPSSTTAYRIVAGDRSALLLLGRDFIGRAVLAATGGWVMGLRGKTLLRAAVGTAGAIEVFVLAYAWWKMNHYGG